MAYSDPQSVTIGTTPGAVSLSRVNSGSETGTFLNYDAKTTLKVGSTFGRRIRRQARIDFSKVTADPLVSSTNVLASGSVYLVIDVPTSGFTAAEQKDLAKGLLTWLTASTDAALIKLIAGEN